MELEQFYGMNYKGKRRFAQDDEPAAHAPGIGAGGDDYVSKQSKSEYGVTFKAIDKCLEFRDRI